MQFMLKDCWRCEFLEQDLKTSAGNPLTLAAPDKVIELSRRGGDPMKLEDVQAIEYAIQMGRGSVWLYLTEDQYRKLKKIR